MGYLSSYAKKNFKKPELLDIKLFVYPNDLLDAVNEDQPDIIGFASYTWNDNLNLQILKYVKTMTKIPIVAIGGIKSNNYKKLLLNKANFLAISSYIWNNKKLKPIEAINKLK